MSCLSLGMYVLMTSVGAVSKMKVELVLHELIYSEDEIGPIRSKYFHWKFKTHLCLQHLSLPPLLPNHSHLSTLPPWR